MLLKAAHFTMKHPLQWMSFDKELGLDSWLGIIVAEAL